MKDSSLKNNQIDFYAIHPGGMKILEACENALGISKKQNQISYDVLSNYGNMSSVTIFFVLKDYLNSFLKSDDGKKILACAFGPGLTMESMIAEVCFSH
jgi:alpha-pyrone synthase